MRRDSLYDLLAPPLILATPFASFVNHNEYGYGAAEIWIALAGVVLAGLLCGLAIVLGRPWVRVVATAGLLALFVDLQFDWLDQQKLLRGPGLGLGLLLLCWLLREHLSRITAPVFATMLAAGLLFKGGSDEWSVKAQAPRADAKAMPTPAPPIVVHLIFDEFIGIEGIPREVPDGTAVRHSLRSFFHSNGFEVFGRAYSRFHNTDNSIPNLLNYVSVPVEAFFTEGKPKRLRNNFYFNDMYEAGYKIRVYQPEYFDFCEGYQHEIASCRTFSNFGISPLKTLQLPEIVKAELILRNFGELSAVWRTFLAYYERLRRKAVRNGYHLPTWMRGSPHLWSAGGFQVLDIVARDVANAAPGDLYFAHLMVPHAPYLYDRSCDLRDPHDWENRPASNTSHSRLHLYRLYLEQVECLQTRLRGIFDSWRRAGVYDRAKVIIHGDHGSRLYLKEPTIANKDQLLNSDYIDSFSTLFAVKAPEPEPKYDRRIVAIQDALAAVTENRPLDELAGRARKPYVFLRNERGSEMMRRPLPNFGDVPVE